MAIFNNCIIVGRIAHTCNKWFSIELFSRCEDARVRVLRTPGTKYTKLRRRLVECVQYDDRIYTSGENITNNNMYRFKRLNNLNNLKYIELYLNLNDNESC